MSLRFNKHFVLLFTFTIFFILFHYTWFWAYHNNEFIINMGLNGGCIAGDAVAAISLWNTYKNSKEKTRHFWMLLALGCTSYLIGDIFWFYEDGFLGLANTVITFSDTFFLLFVIFYLIAFSYKITYEYDLLQKLFILCDIGTTFIAAITLEYYLIIQNILNHHTIPAAAKFIAILYPFCNILLLLICLSLFFRPLAFASKRVLRVLMVSIGMYVIVDSCYDFFILSHEKFSIDLINPFYQISMICTAAAGVLNNQSQLPVNRRINGKKEDKVQFSLSYVAVICLGIYTMIHDSFSYGLCAAFAVVLLRQILVRIQNRKLLSQLHGFNIELSSRIAESTRDLMDQQEALQQNKQKFKSLYELHPDPIFTIDLNGKFQQVNKAGVTLLGYQASDLFGRTYHSFVYEEDLEKALAMSSFLMQGSSSSFEIRAHHKNGDIYYLNVTAVPIRNKDVIHGAYLMVKDITEMKLQQQQINLLAFRDTLTGLANRASFTNNLEQAIREAKLSSTKPALLFIDLDRFKVINDTLGHSIGDLVLVETANRLLACTPSDGMLARLAGDEFTLLLQDLKSPEEIEHIASNILKTLQEPVFIKEHTIHITPSIGIAVYPEAGEDAESLLKHADMAMYTSKNNGKNSFSIYSKEMSEKIKRHLRLEKDLYQALQYNEMFLLYQPQIDLNSERVIGMEALLRWKHPELGFIPPNEFIPIAEDTNLITSIGEWVLREACRQMKAWSMNGYHGLKIGVNVSAKQFKQENFINTVTDILRETDLAPQFLDLELTEGVAMTNEQETLEKLKQLKELGIHISIDDFGTGYSSLAYLPLYPIDRLKIAREFIQIANHSQEGQAIISTILSLAKNLHISVIAEGAETKEQIQFLYEHGCHQVQGYYFSKPIDSYEAARFLERFTANRH
jgi:diguanylate cyclase (GGDEF)-like protein/PAS domain S-box-containing protein